MLTWKDAEREREKTEAATESKEGQRPQRSVFGPAEKLGVNGGQS